MVTVAPANGALRTSVTVPVTSPGGVVNFSVLSEPTGRWLFSAFTCPIDSINTLQMARHKVQHMLFFLMTKRRFWFEIEKCSFKIGKNAAITVLNPLFFPKTFSNKF
jgi:hypothetical protein